MSRIVDVNYDYCDFLQVNELENAVVKIIYNNIERILSIHLSTAITIYHFFHVV